MHYIEHVYFYCLRGIGYSMVDSNMRGHEGNERWAEWGDRIVYEQIKLADASSNNLTAPNNH